METSEPIQDQINSLANEVHQIRFTLTTLSDSLLVRDKTQENELYRLSSLLNCALNSIQEGLLVIDLIGKVTLFNRFFLQLWRIPDSLKEILDEDRFLAYAAEQIKDPEAFLAKTRDLARNHELESLDRIEFTDGRIIERFSMPQKLDGKTVARVQSYRDITEKVKTDKLLHNLNSKLAFLANSSNTLSRSLNFSDTLKSIRRVIVPKLADSYSLTLKNKKEKLECVEFSHPNGALASLAKENLQRKPLDLQSLTGIPKVFRSEKSEFYSETSDQILRDTFPNESFYPVLEQMKIYSIMLIPLIIRGKTYGVLTFHSCSIDRHFTWENLRLSEDIATRISISLDNAILQLRNEKENISKPPTIPKALTVLKHLHFDKLLKIEPKSK